MESEESALPRPGPESCPPKPHHSVSPPPSLSQLARTGPHPSACAGSQHSWLLTCVCARTHVPVHTRTRTHTQTCLKALAPSPHAHAHVTHLSKPRLLPALPSAWHCRAPACERGQEVSRTDCSFIHPLIRPRPPRHNSNSNDNGH